MKTIRIALLFLCMISAIVGRAEVRYDNAVKVTFLSWVTGSTKVSYERAFAPHQSAEVCGSMIGAGYDKFGNRPQGFTLRYGHKFFVAGNEGGGLRGFYVRPEVIYSNFTYNAEMTLLRTRAEMVALLATGGCQTHFGRLLVDAWAGAGYAGGTPADTGYHHGFALWNAFGTKNDNIALSFSIRVGYCF